VGKPSQLAPEQQRTLARLKRVPELAEFYLAGGTAVAHHLRHRTSVDLDLFSRTRDADLDAVARGALAVLDDAEVIAATDATLTMRVGGVEVDVVRYPYPLLSQCVPGPEGFDVPGLRDLAVMKLAAIAKRGIYRDFWDLYAILQEGSVSLDDALDGYLRRFALSASDLYHVLRSLTYFGDAEAEVVMPRGLTPALWATITRFFQDQVPSVARRRLQEDQ
jgi:hypothetical protein